jgi:hypothetical protein
MGSVEIEEKIHRLLMRKIAYYSTRFLFIIGLPVHGWHTTTYLLGEGEG